MDFGTLSLEQVRAIDRAGDAFEAAWRGGDRPRIEEALGEVDAEARPALFDVLLGVELECRRRRGEPVSAGEYLARFPGRAATVEAAFAEARTGTPDPDPDPDAETASWGDTPRPPAPPGPWGRYRVIREHGKGGLGIVFLAHDSELNREVALKEIRPGRCDDPDSQARFLLEAEITGRLEHPGIIPVHSLGRREDGRPYYVMRFIRGAEGKDLGEAIKRLHEPDGDLAGVPRGLLARLPAARGLLARYVGLCHAIAYAHSRKVIHRDIKPSNVLLGPFGETLVIDWGLAKTVESGGATPTADEGTLHAAAAGSATPTERGAAAGSPAYMSPEQADGDVDRLGPASDVFLLGSTLYCLLAGAPPYPGVRDSALARARSWDFRRPRESDPTIPGPLESICLKAMARRPENRYATATELAGDVERWLADEPVSAHRETRGERLARWGRRHRAWVRAAGLALAVVSAVSVASAVLIDWARRRESAASARERDARIEATAQRDRADANFRKALVIIEVVGDAADSVLAGAPRRGGAREDLARATLDQCRALLAQRPADPPARFATARAHRLVGNLLRGRGLFERADGEHLRAVGLLEALAKESPGEPLYRERLAETLMNRGETLRMWGRLADAEEIGHRALARAVRLVEADPGNPAYRKLEALCLWVLADGLVGVGRAHEAVDLLDRAIRGFAPIAEANRADRVLATQWACLLASRGEALREDGREGQARASFEAALAILGPPGAAGTRGEVDARFVRAAVRAEIGRSPAADAAGLRAAIVPLDEAVEGLEALRADFPLFHPYRQALARALAGRASVLLDLGRLKPAGSDLGAAKAHLESLRDAAPEWGVHEGALGRVESLRARLALARDDRAEARALFQEAASHHRAALKANPRSPTDRDDEARAREAAGAPD